MSRERRRELLGAYKERPVRAGVFAVRCAASGQCWTGATENLDTRQNGVWFALRLGSHPGRSLQAAWKAHGAEAFTYEVLEVIEAEEGADRWTQTSRLKDAEARWRETLGADRVAG